MENKKRHWIVRVKDGENFRNSKFPFWGVKRGHGREGAIKTIVRKIKPGDILWFLCSKDYGGKFIAVSEYSGFYDRRDEPFLPVNTLSNEEQGWRGNEAWDIQMHYSNIHKIEHLNRTEIIKCGGTILEYNTFKNKMDTDLHQLYKKLK